MAEEREITANAPEQDLNEMMRVRREKMDAFRAMGVAPFGHRFEVTDYAANLKTKYDYLAEDEEGAEVRVAGRLMAIRGHGKASFSTLNDRTGNIQVYFKMDVLGEQKYKEEFKRLDIGDIIGIRGVVFKTRRGEITVRVEDFGEVPRSEGCGHTLPSALSGSHGKSGGTRDIPQADEDHPVHPPLSRRT